MPYPYPRRSEHSTEEWKYVTTDLKYLLLAETNLKVSKNWTYVEDPSPVGYHTMCSEVKLLGFRKIWLSPSSGRHSWISQYGGTNHQQDVATNMPIQMASNSKILKCSLTVLTQRLICKTRPFECLDEANPEIWHTSLQYLPPYFLMSTSLVKEFPSSIRKGCYGLRLRSFLHFRSNNLGC